MSPEHPPAESGDENLVSPEEWEECLKEADECFQEGKKWFSSNKSRSLAHTLGNLLVAINPDALRRVGTFTTNMQGLYSRTKKDVDYVRRYIALLEEFPDFRAKEEAPGEGAYPDIVSTLKVRDLIDECERRLRGTESKTENRP